MAYDEGVAQRVREILQDYSGVTEKRMFGGIAFMINGNMCSGVVQSELMLRVGPDAYEQCLTRPHARIMDFTGRPMKGFIYVGESGFENDGDLLAWIETAVQFAGKLPPK
ncbi:MAG: TfoX/Sxy family protein [Gammaproteobacteria bacterium]|nr:TfoX/Sxy family protein [Gammaproteobacteria bacterium]MDH5801277.1 TfoX/Sxy family protein [Gammaproteobacteria bacterium]